MTEAEIGTPLQMGREIFWHLGTWLALLKHKEFFLMVCDFYAPSEGILNWDPMPHNWSLTQDSLPQTWAHVNSEARDSQSHRPFSVQGVETVIWGLPMSPLAKTSPSSKPQRLHNPTTQNSSTWVSKCTISLLTRTKFNRKWVLMLIFNTRSIQTFSWEQSSMAEDYNSGIREPLISWWWISRDLWALEIQGKLPFNIRLLIPVSVGSERKRFNLHRCTFLEKSPQLSSHPWPSPYTNIFKVTQRHRMGSREIKRFSSGRQGGERGTSLNRKAESPWDYWPMVTAQLPTQKGLIILTLVHQWSVPCPDHCRRPTVLGTPTTEEMLWALGAPCHRSWP